MAGGGVDLAWLIPRIEAALTNPGTGYPLTLQDLRLAWDSEEGRVLLRADRVRLARPTGETLATAPSLWLELDLGRLARGRVALGTVEVVGLVVRLSRAADGALELGLGGGSDGGAVPAGPLAALLEMGPGDGPLHTLRRIGVRRGELVIDDAASGTVWRLADANFVVTRTVDGIAGELAARMDVAGEQAEIRVHGAMRHPEPSVAIRAQIGAIRLDRLAALGGPFKVLAPLALPVRATLSLVVAGDGSPKDISFDLTGEPGGLALGDGTVIPLADLTIAGTLDDGASEARIDRFRVLAAGLAAEASGTIASEDGKWHTAMTMALGLGSPGALDRPGHQRARLDLAGRYDPGDGSVGAVLRVADLSPRLLSKLMPALAPAAQFDMPLAGQVSFDAAGGGTTRDLRFSFAGQNGVLDLGDRLPRPLAVKSFAVKGHAPNLASLHIEQAVADLGGPIVEIAADLTRVDGKTGVKANVSLRDLPVGDLRHLWPSGIAEGGRLWALDNVTAGMVEEAKISVATTVGGTTVGGGAAAPVSLAGGMRFSGIGVRYFEPLPPVARVNGTAIIASDRIDFRFGGGSLWGLRVESGGFAITDLQAEDQHGAIETRIVGPLRDMMTLLDLKPLGYAQWMGVDPAAVAGEAAVDLKVTLPLIAALKLDDVDIRAKANLTGALIPKIAMGEDLSDGRLAIELDKRRLHVRGEAILAGVATRLDGVETFNGPPDGLRRRFEIEGTLDQAARARLHVDFEPYVLGPVRVAAIHTETFAGAGRVALDVDLSPGTLAMDELAWSKPPGRPGRARMLLTLAGKRPARLDDLTVEAPDLWMAGQVDLMADAIGTRRIALSEFRVGARTSLAIAADWALDGAIDAKLSGAGIDAAPILDRMGRAEAADRAPGPPFAIDARIDRVWLSEHGFVEGVVGNLVTRDNAIDSASIVARSGETGRAHFTVSLERERRDYRLTAADAGGLLAAAGVFASARGGSLTLTASEPLRVADPAMTGEIAIEDFRVIDAPFLARILAAASLTGLLDLLSPDQGLAFDRLEAPFSQQANIVTFKAARAYGGAVGITFHGTVDRRRERLDIEGTVVPAYALNRIIGAIPIIGDILTGEKGGGVFGASYRLAGPTEDPEASVNPLSVLAPGFLRNLFGGLKGETSPTTYPSGGAEGQPGPRGN